MSADGTINSISLTSTDPGNDFAALGTARISTADEVSASVKAARKAFPGWKALGVKRRAFYLEQLLAVFVKRQEEIDRLTSQEMGKPISQSQSSFTWSKNHMRWYLDNVESALTPVVTFENSAEIHHQVLEPWGVAAVITPWNFPISNFAMGAFQALLTGNTVVYKISEEVPLFGLKLQQIATEADLPPGVFSVVTGAKDVGQLLVNGDVDLICFTGSSATGQALYEVAAKKFIPCLLELGGSDAGILFGDADLDSAIPEIFWAKFVNNGQICCGLKRLLVERQIYSDVLNRLKLYIQSQRMGSPLDQQTVFGPLVAKRQSELLAAQVEDAKDKGATVIECLEVANDLKGAYFPVLLLTNLRPEMRAWKEELFGPVLSVIPFDTEQEAIELANATDYGLSGYVFTKDRERFQRIAQAVETGSISLNGCDYSGPHNPFGGYKRSGLGKTGGIAGFANTCRMKVICQPK